MSRFSLRSTAPGRWLTLFVPLSLAFAAPAAHGQGRSIRPQQFTTPSMMRSTTPAMTRSTTPSTTSPATTRSTTPSSTTPSTTPVTTSTQNNALLQRAAALDPRLFGNFPINGSFPPGFGSSPWWGTPFGPSPWWGTGSGGLWGGGVSVIPVGVAGGSTNPVPQKPSGDPADAARTALLQEQAVAERLANRRRAFDELQYEHGKTPTPEEELLSRSRGNSSLAEVRSGQALNVLLADLRRVGVDQLDRSDALLPLDRRGLRHINVTRGLGNIALLKDEGRLTWPAVLAGAAFQGPRERLTSQAPKAVRQVGNPGRVDSGILRQMAADVDQLRQILRQSAKELSYQPFSEARDFLQRFDDAVVALGQPDAADYFNGTYNLKAQTVLGLVTQMTDNGLRFAPAAPGDEAAYAALRESLAACDRVAAKSQSAMR
jgi:hypothetical protein